MKLSFSTLGCPNWSFSKMLDEAQRMGFGGIEIRGIDGNMRAEEITEFLPENVQATQQILLEKGLVLVGFGTSVKFHDADAFDSALNEGKLAIDVCQRMNIPAIRVFGDSIENKAAMQQIQAQVSEGLLALCEYAEGKNVLVLLEIHGDFNTLEAVMPVIAAVKRHPEFGILWDIEHSHKIYRNHWRDFYLAIKPYIRHIHIKDHCNASGENDLCLIGEGEIPIRDIVKTLQADGYIGWYSLEWEKKWHPELPEPETAFPAYLKYMSTLLHD